MRYLKPTRLSCFSPPVMMATFLIEIALAVYISWRYTLSAVTRLAVAILFFLAIFQLAEYNVCEGSFGIDSLNWARLGYIAITMLPPLGFHLATRIAGAEKTGLVTAAYVSAIAFAGFFAFSGQGITSQACLGNYVIFSTAPGVSALYSAYYYGWLIVGTVYAFSMAKVVSKPGHAAALRALAVGYLAFILPTTTVNVIDPSTISGIPSIMCGFAVILAILLAGEVLPQYYKQPSLSGKLRGSGIMKPHGKITK